MTCTRATTSVVLFAIVVLFLSFHRAKADSFHRDDLAVAWMDCIKFKKVIKRGDCITFESRWLLYVKPEPDSGVATTFSDRRGAWGNRLSHSRYENGDVVCAHFWERRGQRLRVTNTANGKSVSCRVEDRGPNRKFWPKREVDLVPIGDAAIGCDGMCNVTIERLSSYE